MSRYPIRWALISVFNKTGISTLAEFLVSKNYHILSTGGTYKAIKESLTASGHADKVKQVSEITEFPEILDGRVKTLHPKIHGSLLAKRSDPSHLATMAEHNIPTISLVISNLYPFQEAASNPASTPDQIIEMIDIGGPTMIRAAAKNYQNVLVVTNPDDYVHLTSEYDRIMASNSQRRMFALKAFQHVTEYNAYITEYFSKQVDPSHPIKTRMYKQTSQLKYGCNPYQNQAAVYSQVYPYPSFQPFSILNGNVGYINYLDAMGSWSLVRDLKESLNLVAAASFKHTSPAGVGTNIPLSPLLRTVYDVDDKELTPLATAYVRARQSDPLSSFGDFLALSEPVDIQTAKLLKREVSDGIIAPGYAPEALEILKQKKRGNFIIIEVNDPDWNPTQSEFREIGGIAISQTRNTVLTTPEDLNQKNIVTIDPIELHPAVVRDLIIANTTLKYTQSNSVCFAYDGQVVGVGSGQQNRVDCVRLAAKKALIWLMRQCSLPDDPIYDTLSYFQKLKTDPTLKRQDRVNKVMDFCRERLESFEEDGNSFETILGPYNGYNRLSLVSDAFFPFPDSIEVTPSSITKFILQPGGSTGDQAVIDACNQKGITMVFSGKRMFTH